jgi:hypothetical protein
MSVGPAPLRAAGRAFVVDVERDFKEDGDRGSVVDAERDFREGVDVEEGLPGMNGSRRTARFSTTCWRTTRRFAGP